MWLPEHDAVLDEFAGGGSDIFPRLLVAYIDPVNGLVLGDGTPYSPVTELAYFIRRRPRVPAEAGGDGIPPISPETFLQEVQYGIVTGRHIESLLRIMTGIYVPMFFRNTSWPDRSQLFTFLRQN